MSLSELETQLGYPPIGKVPATSDACLAAQASGTPLISFQPDSALAESMNMIAARWVSALSMQPVTA